MPAQCLRTPPVARLPASNAIGWRAGALIGATLALTLPAILALYGALGADSIGPLDLIILATFAPLFAWTAFSFLGALAGFLVMANGARAGLPASAWRGALALNSRTAVLLPIYNENTRAVLARLAAMIASVEAAGTLDHFAFFVLSDSTDAQTHAEEVRGVEAMRRRLPRGAELTYRHRPLNTDRKAGNIAEWVRRWGAGFDHMVTLDADSLMEGETLMRLAVAMERHPRIGLIQTTPTVVNRHSLFARAEQFASRLYGPMLARGIAWWSGDQANYWGHNAIIRVAAFAAQAGLPRLGGRKPFGGHILSHDFVEAALLRRAGWGVVMAPELGGSYEESPPTLADHISRDRRWQQGNLQHLRILGAHSLTPLSRLHLLRGVSSYLTAPLWLILLVAGALLPMKPEWGAAAGPFAAAHAGGPDPAILLALFCLSMAFLLAPKLLAMALAARTVREAAGFGGRSALARSVALETALSVLLAPVLMLNQIWALIGILAGHDAGWGAQHREEESLSLEAAADRHLGDAAIGVILAAAAWSASPAALVLMAPVIAGLIACIPLAALTASPRFGERLRRAGLLLVPEEVAPPPVVAAFHRSHAADAAESAEILPFPPPVTAAPRLGLQVSMA